MAKLVVIGGSSGVGLACVKEALQRGHTVRMFSRSATRTDIADERLDKVDGDALKPADVSRSIEGYEVVLQTLGVPLNLKLVTGPITLFSKSTEVLVPAIREAGIERLVALTGFGAGDSEPAVPFWQRPGFKLMLGRAYDDKGIQEQLIKESGISWTIARPGVLLNGAKTGEYRVLTEFEEWQNGRIRRADVAEFMVSAAESGGYVGQAPVLISQGLLPFT